MPFRYETVEGLRPSVPKAEETVTTATIEYMVLGPGEEAERLRRLRRTDEELIKKEGPYFPLGR